MIPNPFSSWAAAQDLLEKVHDLRNPGEKFCALAAYESGVYRANRQPELPDFYPPFGGKLDPENR